MIFNPRLVKTVQVLTSITLTVTSIVSTGVLNNEIATIDVLVGDQNGKPIPNLVLKWEASTSPSVVLGTMAPTGTGGHTQFQVRGIVGTPKAFLVNPGPGLFPSKAITVNF